LVRSNWCRPMTNTSGATTCQARSQPRPLRPGMAQREHRRALRRRRDGRC
jgi:hypothetical protein